MHTPKGLYAHLISGQSSTVSTIIRWCVNTPRSAPRTSFSYKPLERNTIGSTRPVEPFGVSAKPLRCNTVELPRSTEPLEL